MGLSNQELINKAVITTDAIAAQGKLNPIQSDTFLDFVFDESKLAKAGVRTVKFSSEQMLIEKINVADRVAVPAAEAADPGLRRGVTTSKITLEPKEIMVPFEVGDLIKEENIEGASLEEHIIQMMAKKLSNNIEQLYWFGNTLGPAVTEDFLKEGGSTSLYVKDSYLGLFDGLLKLAEGGHVLDALNGQLKPTLISKALRQLPTKFRIDKSQMKFMTSEDNELHFREGVSSRATMAGDSALMGDNNLKPFGIELSPFALLAPNPQFVEHVTVNSDGTTPTQLAHAPITDVVVTPTSLGSAPTAKFIITTDYSQDLANGTVTRLGGAIGAGATVKVTYNTAGRSILTKPSNIVLAVGRDITIERDRNIYKRVNEFAIHAKIFATFEEVDAVTLVKNIQVPA